MANDIFDKFDTSLYTSWKPEHGGVVIVHIPGVGELKMTLAKAEEISADLARQAAYGRWHAMEVRHNESQKNPSA